MNEIVLVTTNFGIDKLKPFPFCADVNTVCYTDVTTLESTSSEDAASWTRIVVPDYPQEKFTPRLRSHYFKQQIHRLPETAGYRWLVWADASLQFVDPVFLVEQSRQLASLRPDQRLLFVPHPDRQTVREEYEFVRDEIRNGNEYLRIRYDIEKMTGQMEFFRQDGMNLEAKLWCGTMWMVENNALINQLLDSWWEQVVRFGVMDQLPLPVLLERLCLEPQSLSVNLWDNRYFRYVSHQKFG